MNKSLPVTFNTAIGGVSATISTAALLATKLAISVGNITNFEVVGSDIKCMITGSYAIPSSAFAFNTTPCTYYIDSDYLVTSLGSQSFYYTNISGVIDFQNATSISDSFTGTPLLNEILLKNATSIGNNAFAQSTNGTRTLRTCYIPSATSLGTTSGDNGVFTGNCVGLKVYAHPSLATSNGGSPDGDLAYVTTNGGTVAYVSNFTAPNPVTTLASGTIYNTAIQLNFTPPSSTNAIDYYEVWLNGVNSGKTITVSGQYITGLTASTPYSITIIAVDIFYNKSVVSNTAVQSTSNNSWDITTGLVSYYKLDESSGNALDNFGSKTLTNTGITANQSGKIGTSYLSTTLGQKLETTLATPITSNFSINIWCYRTASPNSLGGMIQQGGYESNSGFGIWSYVSGNLSWRVNQTFSGDSSLLFIPLNTWTMVTMVYNGINVKMFLNSIEKTSTAHTANPNTTTKMTLFYQINNNAEWFGRLDEASIYNTALTQTQIDLIYNSGTGITL